MIEKFINKFSLFANVPNGADQLRSIVIQLGIKGLLVEQREEEGDAHEEIKRILALKSNLIKQKQFKSSIKLEKIEVEIEPYKLPKNWLWTTLATIGQINPRNIVDDDVECSFIPMASISQIYNGSLTKEARLWLNIKKGFTHLKEEDVALAKITPCFQNSKAAVMRGLHNNFGAGTTELHVFRAIPNTVLPEYVYLYLKSPKFIQDGIPKMTGSAGQKRIPVDYFAGTPFPLPPIKEQKRIITKVDELMALCDKLEEQQQQQANTLLQANTSSIDALLNPENQQSSFDKNWQRIAKYFNTLYGCTLPMPETTGRKKKYLAGLENINELRNSVLQLAISGKLTKRENDDCLVSTIIEAALTIKENYSKEFKIRQGKKLSSLDSKNFPYSIPKAWTWCQLNDLSCYIQRGKSPKYDDLGSTFVVSQKCIQWDGFSLSKARHIDENSLNKYGEERFLLNGDLLWNSTGTGTVGRVALAKFSVDTRVVADSHVTVIRLTNAEPRYIWCCIASPWVQLRINPEHEDALVSGSTKQVELNTTTVKELPIPLPPLEEQKRIVAKVDQLIELCDKLEEQLTQSYDQAEKLMEATVKALVT